MAERQVTDKDGGVGFRLQRYVWRSKPTASPLTGRPVRCVVGQDENGQFRPATRIGMGKEPNPAIETKFAIEPFASRQEAIQASRELTRDFLSMEAEVYSQGVKDKEAGQEIVKVQMDDGWSTSINAAEKPSSPLQDDDVKSVVWEGPLAETDEGRHIHGAVSKTQTGEFRAGFGAVYSESGPKGGVIETGVLYSWKENKYTVQEEAIVAAKKEAEKQVAYDAAEPGRRNDTSGHKPGSLSAGGFAKKLFDRPGRTPKKAPVQQKRSRSIDR